MVNLQQDNDPQNISKLCQTLFKIKEKIILKIMEWPLIFRSVINTVSMKQTWSEHKWKQQKSQQSTLGH